MPYQDGTGPFGDGRLGRGQGPCGRGRAMVARGGGRRGFFGFGRRAANPNLTPESDSSMYPYTKEDLLAQKKELEDRLNWIEKQISE